MTQKYVKAIARSELPPGTLKAVLLGDEEVCLVNADGTIYAVSDLCTHEECPLSEEGEIDGGEIECTCHGSRFDLRTGEVTNPPAIEPLKHYDVRVEGDDVLIQGA